MSHARTDASSSTSASAACAGLERGPDLQPILGLEPFEHERQIGGMEASQPALQIDDVLSLLQLHGDAALSPILSARQRLESAMMLEQRRDLVEGLMQIGGRSSIRHNAPESHTEFTRLTSRFHVGTSAPCA